MTQASGLNDLRRAVTNALLPALLALHDASNGGTQDITTLGLSAFILQRACSAVPTESEGNEPHPEGDAVAESAPWAAELLEDGTKLLQQVLQVIQRIAGADDSLSADMHAMQLTASCLVRRRRACSLFISCDWLTM